jgi:hypothetical protein
MNAEVAGYIAAWRPTSVPAEAACFARRVVAREDSDRIRTVIPIESER